MNCANIWGPSDHSGRLQRPKPKPPPDKVGLTMNQINLSSAQVSSEARDLVQKLLLADPNERLTAVQCLSHPWLSGDVIYIDVLNELETTWMRRCLARRR